MLLFCDSYQYMDETQGLGRKLTLSLGVLTEGS